MDRGNDLGKRYAFTTKGRIKTECTGESLIDCETVAGKIPVPRPDDRTCLQGELYALDVLTRQRFADSQAILRFAPGCDVVEDDGDLPIGGIADPYCTHVEPAAERLGIVLEIRCLAGLRDVTISIEPEPLQIRGKFCDPFATQVDAGLTFESRICLKEAIVHGLIVLVKLHLDDGERRLHGIEDRREPLLCLAKGSSCEMLFRAVAKDLHVSDMMVVLVEER